MPVVYACLTPHGGEILPELAGEDLETVAPTRAAMEEIGRRMTATQPDVIVVATPHGLRLEGYNAVVTAAYSEGRMEGPGGVVEARFACDRTLARDIVRRTAAAGIPVVGCNYGALEGPASMVPLDWGALIPLYFMGARTGQSPEERPQIVLVGPTRDIPLVQLVRFGEIIAEAADSSGKRVGFVASADQAHAHDASGPYGFDPAAAEYDARVADIVRRDRLEELLAIPLDTVERAKPDSLWQMVMLLGVSRHTPLKGEFLSYQVPSYFGMLCASYTPVRA